MTKRKPQAKTKTRQDELLRLLRRKNGVSVEELTAAWGIQTHSARALITYARRAGHEVTVIDVGRYRLGR